MTNSKAVIGTFSGSAVNDFVFSFAADLHSANRLDRCFTQKEAIIIWDRSEANGAR